MNKEPETLGEAWEQASPLEKTGMVAIGAATVVTSLWVLSPNFRAGIKAAVAIAAGNSAGQDLYTSWKQTMAQPMIQHVLGRKR